MKSYLAGLRLRSTRLLAACVLGFATILPATAASVVPLYLDEIIDRSAVAFEGVCVQNWTEREAATGFVVTYTKFEVRDALKGFVGATHVIKQIGGSLPGENVQFEVMGVPKFAVGETYVVFLAGVSSAGFSSPVGLAQGRFNVSGMGEAREVTNGRDFRDLIPNPEQKAMTAGTRAKLQQAPDPMRRLNIDEFKQLVRERAGAK